MAGVPQLVPATPREIKQIELPDELRHCLLRASDLLRRRRAETADEPLPTSLAGFDRLLGGGLPRGRLVELVGRGSCGRFAALLSALRSVTGAGEAAALIDQGAQLDPQAAAGIGVDLEHLLWLRPRNLGDSLAAAELLLHTGFQLVAVDLGLPPVRGRAPLAAWLRLARTAAAHGAVVLVGSPYRVSGCAAGAVVTGGRGRGDWSSAGPFRLLSGLQARLSLARRVGHPDLGEASVDLALPEAAFAIQPETTTTEAGMGGKFEIRNPKSEIPIEGRNEHVTAV